ncbi:MAG: hypothetical protein ACRERD_32920, partial [Candidatus Binatia bacterium]
MKRMWPGFPDRGWRLDRVQSIPFSWLVNVSVAVGLFLALLLNGGVRGLYSDDYAFKRTALDLATGTWQPKLIDPTFRPVAQTIIGNLAVALP